MLNNSLNNYNENRQRQENKSNKVNYIILSLQPCPAEE